MSFNDMQGAEDKITNLWNHNMKLFCFWNPGSIIFFSVFFFHSVGIPKTISYCAAIFIPNERKPCDIFCNVDFFIHLIGRHRYNQFKDTTDNILCCDASKYIRLKQKSTCIPIVSCQLLYVLSNMGTSDRIRVQLH